MLVMFARFAVVGGLVVVLLVCVVVFLLRVSFCRAAAAAGLFNLVFS